MEIWEAISTLKTDPWAMTGLAIALVALGYAWGKGWLALKAPGEKFLDNS